MKRKTKEMCLFCFLISSVKMFFCIEKFDVLASNTFTVSKTKQVTLVWRNKTLSCSSVDHQTQNKSKRKQKTNPGKRKKPHDRDDYKSQPVKVFTTRTS